MKFRYQLDIDFSLFRAYAALLFLYIVVLASILGLYKSQLKSPLLIFPNIVLSDWSYQPKSCWETASSGINTTTKCELASNGNILLFGDSHAQQLVFGFDRLISKSDDAHSKKLIFLSSHLMRGNWRSKNFKENPQVHFIRSYLSKTSENDLIVFSITSAHLQDSVYGDLTQRGRLQVELAELLAHVLYSKTVKAKVILMLDTPRLKNNVARICWGDEGKTRDLCQLERLDYDRQNSYLNTAYSHLKTLNVNRGPAPQIVSPASLFCRSDRCSLYDESGFMLIDGNHIKMSVSHKLVEEFFREIL